MKLWSQDWVSRFMLQVISFLVIWNTNPKLESVMGSPISGECFLRSYFIELFLFLQIWEILFYILCHVSAIGSNFRCNMTFYFFEFCFLSNWMHWMRSWKTPVDNNFANDTCSKNIGNRVCSILSTCINKHLKTRVGQNRYDVIKRRSCLQL